MKNKRIFTVITLLLLVVIITFATKNTFASHLQGFATRKGKHLTLNNQPFYFSTANQYYLFYKSHYMIDDQYRSA